jgi:hypothetical protein
VYVDLQAYVRGAVQYDLDLGRDEVAVVVGEAEVGEADVARDG